MFYLQLKSSVHMWYRFFYSLCCSVMSLQTLWPHLLQIMQPCDVLSDSIAYCNFANVLHIISEWQEVLINHSALREKLWPMLVLFFIRKSQCLSSVGWLNYIWHFFPKLFDAVLLVSICEYSCGATDNALVTPLMMLHVFVLNVHSLVALGEGDLLQMCKSARRKPSSRCFCGRAGFFKIQHRLVQMTQSTYSHFRQHCSSSLRDRCRPGPIICTCHISYCHHVFRAVDIWAQNEQVLKIPLIYCCDAQSRLIEHYRGSGDTGREDTHKRDATVIKLTWIS